MSENLINRIYDTNDSIGFGQMRNEPFKWIYRLSLPYFIWLIDETNICFADLSIFYQFGKPLKLDKNLLSKAQEAEIINLTKALGTNSRSGNSEAYLITIEILTNIMERKIVKPIHFKEYDFEFNENTIISNNRKLAYCTSSFNEINIERDKYLTSLFLY